MNSRINYSRLMFVFFVITSLLVSGCGSKQAAKRDLYTGSKGVTLSFPEQNSFQHFSDDSFSIAMRMENDGAQPIKSDNPGIVSVVVDPSVFELVRGDSRMTKFDSKSEHKYIKFALDSRTFDNQVTGVDYVDFTFKALKLTDNRAKLESPIIFQVCYPYVTTYVKNTCVDRDYYTQKDTPVCLAKTVSGSSQGAPVAVTNIEPRFVRLGVSAVKPRYKLTLTNLQPGYILHSPDAKVDEICTLEDFDSDYFNKIAVTASLGSTVLKCGGETNVARFEGRTANIICEVKDNDPAISTLFATGANYETPLTIQLRYFYISQLTAAIEVEKP